MKYLSLTPLFLFSLIPSIATSATSLNVPFTSQAPFGDWSEPWHNACEEAAIVMVDFEYADYALSPAVARDEILKVLRVKNNAFGRSFDESADAIARLINDFFPWEARVIENPTLEQLKSEIDDGRLVIVPVYGKALKNPYFRDGGPEYHTIVLSGYDDETREFITQDPGTRRGLDYRYSFDTLLDAMHDLVPGGPMTAGRKAAIFTTKSIRDTEFTDADNDGLGKRQEMARGTILYLADSDGDGITDGDEVKRGFLPTLAENKLPTGSLIKSPSDPKVYLLENATKRHIVNEAVFWDHGWDFADVVLVSEAFVASLADGENIDK